MTWAPDYITLDDLKNNQRIPDTVDDVELAVYITAASRAIDYHTNRQFGLAATAEVRYYDPWYDYERCLWVYDIDDLMTTTGFAFTIDGTAVTDYALEPRNAAAKGRPWTRLVIGRASTVKPTGVDPVSAFTLRPGWTTVPVSVTLAARLQSARFAFRRDSPHGIAGSPDQGAELRLLARVDPDVGVSLRGLDRPRKVG